MARKKPTSETNNILAQTSIAPDLLAVLDGGRQKKTARKTAKAGAPPVFNVIIEFNRDFVGGIGGARLTLLGAYTKARSLPDFASLIDQQLLPALARAQPVVDDSLAALFDPLDSVDIEKSMWTDNYVFAKLSRETIGKLSDWKLPSSKSPTPNKPIRLVPPAVTRVLCFRPRARSLALPYMQALQQHLVEGQRAASDARVKSTPNF